MEKSIPIEDREKKDYEKEIIELRLHENAVVPKEFFPYSLFITSRVGEQYYGRVFVYDQDRLRQDCLYFRIEQDQDEITVRRIAEREYYEVVANEMMRK